MVGSVNESPWPTTATGRSSTGTRNSRCAPTLPPRKSAPRTVDWLARSTPTPPIRTPSTSSRSNAWPKPTRFSRIQQAVAPTTSDRTAGPSSRQGRTTRAVRYVAANDWSRPVQSMPRQRSSEPAIRVAGCRALMPHLPRNRKPTDGMRRVRRDRVHHAADTRDRVGRRSDDKSESKQIMRLGGQANWSTERVGLGCKSPLRHERMFDSPPEGSMNLGCFRVKKRVRE
jgi:hypothetical protein